MTEPARLLAPRQQAQEPVAAPMLAPGPPGRLTKIPPWAESARAAESAQSSDFSPGGKIWFKSGEKKTPDLPLGAFKVYLTGNFEAEAQIAPVEREAAGRSSATRSGGAPGGKAEGGTVASEATGGWEFRAGPTHSISKAKEQGVKAELEYKLADTWPSLLESLRPDSVKAEGELTGEGYDVSFGGKWVENKKVNYELKLTAIGGKWEEGSIRILDLGLSRNQEWSKKWVIGGVFAEVTIKGVGTLHVEPDWKKIVPWLATQGIAIGVAVGVAGIYVAWVGYGLYQIDQQHARGRLQGMTYAFLDGYSDALAAVTSEPIEYTGKQITDLLAIPWQELFNNTAASRIDGRIDAVDAGKIAREAGRAAIVHFRDDTIRVYGLEGWQRISRQHRSRYGADKGTRQRAYREIMTHQVLQGKPTGIETPAP